MHSGGAGFRDLPVELVEGVVAEARLSDCLALAQVSRLLNTVSTRVIYSAVDLKSPEILTGACKALSGNRLAAQSVQTLVISTTFPSIYLEHFYTLLEKALSGCSNITALKIKTEPTDDYGAVLRKCTFPKLEIFQYLYIDEDAIDFLRRHPSIRHLNFARDRSCKSFQYSSPPVTLPQLRSLVSRSLTFPFIVSTSPVQFADVAWDSGDPAHINEVLQALSQSSRPLVSFSAELPLWSGKFMQSVAEHLHGIQMLEIVNIASQFAPAGLYRTFVRELTSLLPNFKQLERIILAVTEEDLEDPTLVTLYADHEFATGLGEACPTLVSCRFPTEVDWFRHRWGFWIPNPQIPVCEEWWNEFFFSFDGPIVAKSHEAVDLLLADAKTSEERIMVEIVKKIKIGMDSSARGAQRNGENGGDGTGTTHEIDADGENQTIANNQEAPQTFRVNIHARAVY